MVRAQHQDELCGDSGLDGARDHQERALQREGRHLVLRSLFVGAAKLRGALQECGQLGNYLGSRIKLTAASDTFFLPGGIQALDQAVLVSQAEK